MFYKYVFLFYLFYVLILTSEPKVINLYLAPSDLLKLIFLTNYFQQYILMHFSVVTDWLTVSTVYKSY